MEQNMNKVSQNFSLAGSDWYDISLDTDQKLFIDPAVLLKRKVKGFDGKGAFAMVVDYMTSIYSKVDDPSKEKQLNQLLVFPHEINETRLGYSNGKAQGKGPSLTILKRSFKQLKQSSIPNDLLTRRPQTMMIFTPNFDADRFSDLVTNLIVLQLVKFTQYVFESSGVKLQHEATINYFDVGSDKWATKTVSLPVDSNDRPFILCPKFILSEKYSFSVGTYIWRVILTVRQAALTEGKNVPTKKEIYEKDTSGIHKDIAKTYALQETFKDPLYFREYLELLGLQ